MTVFEEEHCFKHFLIPMFSRSLKNSEPILNESSVFLIWPSKKIAFATLIPPLNWIRIGQQERVFQEKGWQILWCTPHHHLTFLKTFRQPLTFFSIIGIKKGNKITFCSQNGEGDFAIEHLSKIQNNSLRQYRQKKKMKTLNELFSIYSRLSLKLEF